MTNKENFVNNINDPIFKTRSSIIQSTPLNYDARSNFEFLTSKSQDYTEIANSLFCRLSFNRNKIAKILAATEEITSYAMEFDMDKPYDEWSTETFKIMTKSGVLYEDNIVIQNVIIPHGFALYLEAYRDTLYNWLLSDMSMDFYTYAKNIDNPLSKIYGSADTGLKEFRINDITEYLNQILVIDSVYLELMNNANTSVFEAINLLRSAICDNFDQSNELVSEGVAYASDLIKSTGNKLDKIVAAVFSDPVMEYDKAQSDTTAINNLLIPQLSFYKGTAPIISFASIITGVAEDLIQSAGGVTLAIYAAGWNAIIGLGKWIEEHTFDAWDAWVASTTNPIDIRIQDSSSNDYSVDNVAYITDLKTDNVTLEMSVPIYDLDETVLEFNTMEDLVTNSNTSLVPNSLRITLPWVDVIANTRGVSFSKPDSATIKLSCSPQWCTKLKPISTVAFKTFINHMQKTVINNYDAYYFNNLIERDNAINALSAMPYQSLYVQQDDFENNENGHKSYEKEMIRGYLYSILIDLILSYYKSYPNNPYLYLTGPYTHSTFNPDYFVFTDNLINDYGSDGKATNLTFINILSGVTGVNDDGSLINNFNYSNYLNIGSQISGITPGFIGRYAIDYILTNKLLSLGYMKVSSAAMMINGFTNFGHSRFCVNSDTENYSLWVTRTLQGVAAVVAVTVATVGIYYALNRTSFMLRKRAQAIQKLQWAEITGDYSKLKKKDLKAIGLPVKSSSSPGNVINTKNLLTSDDVLSSIQTVKSLIS